MCFEDIYKVRRDSTGKSRSDPSMYLGSGGYAFALHRVLKFLRYDKIGSHTSETYMGSGEDIFKIEKA